MRAVVDELIRSGVEARIVVESEHREAILPLVLGGIGLAVFADSWRELAERAGALVLDLDPPRTWTSPTSAGPDRSPRPPGSSSTVLFQTGRSRGRADQDR